MIRLRDIKCAEHQVLDVCHKVTIKNLELLRHLVK
jgi:hypothetical protein